MSDSLMKTYNPQSVAFEKGDGVWIWDNHGNKYLDALCGIAVTGLGHNYPAVTEALATQAGRLIHTSNLYTITLQKRLAEKLCQKAGMDAVFFSNSGAEANEAAIKIARLYGRQKGIDIPTIITMKGSFHGRTMATLSATGNEKVQAGFAPLVSGFEHVEYDNITAIEKVASTNPSIVAIMVEPIQGEGGINIPAADYLQSLRQICDKHQWLLMLDEIQTGMGRTGKWFGFQHTQISPDVMTLAKGLANGVPIGACLAKGAAAEMFKPGNHGSTFGGNPLSCAAACAVIDSIEQHDLVSRAEALGQQIRQGLEKGLKNNPLVSNIRNQGLLIGISLTNPCADLVKLGLDEGILINVTAGNVVRLLPPLILLDSEADLLVEKVVTIIKHFSNSTVFAKTQEINKTKTV